MVDFWGTVCHLFSDVATIGFIRDVVMVMCCVCVYLLFQKLSDSMSFSEGSTVDLQPLKERRESFDFELELPEDDPDPCFTQGETITAGAKLWNSTQTYYTHYSFHYEHLQYAPADSCKPCNLSSQGIVVYRKGQEKSKALVGAYLTRLNSWWSDNKTQPLPKPQLPSFIEPDCRSWLTAGNMILCWSCLLLTVFVKSGYLSYCSLPLSSNQSGIILWPLPAV